MYLEGAAWASLFAQIVMAIMAVVMLKRKTSILRIPRTLHPEVKHILVMTANLIIRALALNVALWVGAETATSIHEDAIADAYHCDQSMVGHDFLY